MSSEVRTAREPVKQQQLEAEWGKSGGELCLCVCVCGWVVGVHLTIRCNKEKTYLGDREGGKKN